LRFELLKSIGIMKHFALLISILSITFSCANQKNTRNKAEINSTQINKEIPLKKSNFAPGTLALSLKITDIISHDNYKEIIASVEKRLGSGAGIIGIYSKGTKVTFISKHDRKLRVNSSYKLLFKESQVMGSNKSTLKLIKQID